MRADRFGARYATIGAAFLVSLYLGVPASLSAQSRDSAASPVVRPPTGYYLGASAKLPDFAIDTLAGGRFTVRIVRTAASPHERLLLSIAEVLFPDSVAIRTVGARERAPASIERQKAAGLAPGQRWWYDRFDLVWTPFAITGQAVEYYRSMIYQRSAILNPFRWMDSTAVHRGSLDYRAWVGQVSSKERPAARYVVHLELDWSYWCGRRCAVGFRHFRRVYFDSEGMPIAVEGDGRPMVMVS